MTAKEYLSQAYWLDQSIDNKIKQVSDLHTMATKATNTLSDMPGSPNRNVSKMENIIVKILDLEQEINNEIDRLVDLKKEINSIINGMDNPEFKLILELRYQNFWSWEQIAVEMGYSIHHLYKILNKALAEVEKRIPSDIE